MNYVKRFGLLVLGIVAILALAGMGSASATVLCKTAITSGCATGGWDYSAGTSMHITLQSGFSSIFEDTSGNTLLTCTEGTVRGKTSNTGSSGEAVKGSIEVLTWGSAPTPCTTTLDTNTLGSLAVNWITSTNNGTLSGSGSKWTTNIFGVSCVYGTGAGTTLGTVTGGERATIDINAVINKQEGGFLCPSTTKWTASYVINEPKPLYIAES